VKVFIILHGSSLHFVWNVAKCVVSRNAPLQVLIFSRSGSFRLSTVKRFIYDKWRSVCLMGERFPPKLREYLTEVPSTFAWTYLVKRRCCNWGVFVNTRNDLWSLIVSLVRLVLMSYPLPANHTYSVTKFSEAWLVRCVFVTQIRNGFHMPFQLA